MPLGQCTLPSDESGRILDRLAGLEPLVSPEILRQALAATGRINQRRCKLTHEVVCWVVLAMGILTDLPIRQVFKHARQLRVGETTPHRSSLCVARRRLGIGSVRSLFERVVHPLAGPETPGAFYFGFRVSPSQSQPSIRGGLLRDLTPEILRIWDRHFFSYTLRGHE